MTKVNNCLMMVSERSKPGRVRFVCEDVYCNCHYWEGGNKHIFEDGSEIVVCSFVGKCDKYGVYPCLNKQARSSVMGLIRISEEDLVNAKR